MNSFSTGPIKRPRRLRQDANLRAMLSSTRVLRSDIIVPIFVTNGVGVRREVKSMPGVFQMSVDVACEFLAARSAAGFRAFIVFGVIEREAKDAVGSAATDEKNVVCTLLQAVVRANIQMTAITDLCMCEYTSHGHCGPLDDNQQVINDKTLMLLVKQAVNHARAGAKVIAPSGMMDGTIAALRRGLDDAGFASVSLLAYAVKYASAFYGPFRDAADSVPTIGDRKNYQMDPSRDVREALLEADLDVQEGADMIMVKPALAYLDVIRAVREKSTVPVVAYQVSGEYAMIEAAAQNGWIDRDRVLMESLVSMKRAGADLIISYYAELLEKLLPLQA